MLLAEECWTVKTYDTSDTAPFSAANSWALYKMPEKNVPWPDQQNMTTEVLATWECSVLEKALFLSLCLFLF